MNRIKHSDCRPGMILCTSAGNKIVRLVKRSEFQPEWVKAMNDVEWEVELLFDSSLDVATPKMTVIAVTNLVLFDVLRWSLVVNQFMQVKSALDRWSLEP